ncbi:MAG: ATP synthase subunit I [Pyrinomonadaceae bacterium]
MGDDSEPLTDIERPFAAISHRRILYEMAGIIAVGTIAGFAFVSAKVGFGVFVGGILAFANYFWQKRSLKAIFDRAIDGKRSHFLALRYILRYVVLGGVLMLIYLSHTVSIVAVIFGLSSFAIAVVIEGFISVFSNSYKKES